MGQSNFLRVKNGDEIAFENMFREYYPKLVNFAQGIIKDRDVAEEQVQEAFANLWEKRLALKEDLHVFPYLLNSVRNKCFNIVNRKLVENKYKAETQSAYQATVLDYSYDENSEELVKKLNESLTKLPPKCHEVFKLSRYEGLSHKAIGEKLGISTKTVENHITKALRILKENLRNGIIPSIVAIGFLLT